MRVRIRFGKVSRVRRHRNSGRRFALVMSSLLTPCAFVAGVLGAWGIAADLKTAAAFAISAGPFSHWEIWLLAAAGLQFCSHMLKRYGRNEDQPVA